MMHESQCCVSLHALLTGEFNAANLLHLPSIWNLQMSTAVSTLGGKGGQNLWWPPVRH